MGLAAGELAIGAAAEGLRRFTRGEAGNLGSVLLSAPNARRLAARLARLRGAAMKIGQLASLQSEDVLPPEFAQALAVLRAQAAPMPAQQLRRVLGRDQPASGRVVLLDFGATQRFSAAFAANYARITRGVLNGDRNAVAREAIRIGYAATGDAPARMQAVIDMIFLACEPLRHVGRYDFAKSDLPSRVRRSDSISRSGAAFCGRRLPRPSSFTASS